MQQKSHRKLREEAGGAGRGKDRHNRAGGGSLREMREEAPEKGRECVQSGGLSRRVINQHYSLE
jgi:hypothetical protein